MELRQLRHFLALAEVGSFTGAAVREHIVQSGLSNSVQALERELGAELYVRGSRPVRLTPAGEALLEPARLALKAVRNAREAVRDVQNVMVGQLRIGVIGSALPAVPFADYIAGFATAHPAVDVHLCQAGTTAMLRMVGSGELDCAIVPSVAEAVVGVRFSPLAHDRLVLVCRDDHPLTRVSYTRLPELAGERFVDVTTEWSARGMIDAAFMAAGVAREVRYEVNEWRVFLELVTEAWGIGFVPEGLALEATAANSSRLRTVQVRGVTLDRHIQLALPRASDTTPAARSFAEHVLQHHSPATPDECAVSAEKTGVVRGLRPMARRRPN